jgi:transposase-like protein
MPWEERTPVAERKRFVEEALKREESIAALCRRYGVSRKTAYKRLKRYREQGEAGLADRSRRPHRTPRRTAEMVEARGVAARREHPAWGARKLRACLKDDSPPAVSTLNAILQRHDQIDPALSAQHRPMQRFEHPTPNALWQMDFKGDWPLADAAIPSPRWMTIRASSSRWPPAPTRPGIRCVRRWKRRFAVTDCPNAC